MYADGLYNPLHDGESETVFNVLPFSELSIFNFLVQKLSTAASLSGFITADLESLGIFGKSSAIFSSFDFPFSRLYFRHS